jgi:hypothetical protein
VLSNNIQFLENNSVIYPTKWKGILWGHHELVLEVCSENYCNKELKEFVQSAPVDSTIIFSSENFESISASAINRLDFLKKIANVKVVYFHRHFQDLAYSLWQESIKHGSYDVFSRFLFNNYSMPYQSPNINFFSKVDKYIDIFGVDNVDVVNYNKLRDEKTDLAVFFLQKVCGLSDFPYNGLVISDERINSSFSCEIIECIRALNFLFFKKYNKKADCNLREKFMRLLNEGEINLRDINFLYDPSYRLYKISIPVDLVTEGVYSNLTDKYKHFEYKLKKHREFLVASSDTWICNENNKVLNDYFNFID